MLPILALTVSLNMAPSVRVSVEGNGFLQFVQDGHALYASSAPLTVVDGWIANADGAPMLPILRVPSGTVKVDVDREGNVFAATRSFKGKVGQISLAVFGPNSDLRPYGSFLVSSQRPQQQLPGDGSAGLIHVLTPAEALPETPKPEPMAARPLPSPNDAFVRNWVNFPAEIFKPSDARVAPVVGPATITVNIDSDAPSDHYTLADIAQISADDSILKSLEGTRIGDTPVLGKQGKVTKERVVEALANAGFDTDLIKIEMPGRAFIRKSSQAVLPDTICGVAEEAAKKIYGQDAQAQGRLRGQISVVPAGNVELHVESCIQTSYGASVIVVSELNGARLFSYSVRVSVNGADQLRNAG